MQGVKAPRHEEDDEKWEIAWDDMSGVELDPEDVKRARKEEITYFKERRVYTKMPRSKVPKGEKVIRVRWVDINKGDKQNKDIRCRLVAMDFKDADRPDLFAGTPPLEGLRLLCSLAATVEDEEGEEMALMVNDVKRAYFYVPVNRPIYI